jgi:hypothetical protein
MSNEERLALVDAQQEALLCRDACGHWRIAVLRAIWRTCAALRAELTRKA